MARPFHPQSVRIDAVLAGRARPFARGQASAIAKRRIGGYVHVGALGIEGDEQADRVAHGGRDMAVHHYPFEHYGAWIRDLAREGDPRRTQNLLSRPGAFGENVSTTGLTETDICVGDLWGAGTVLLEVSQARQPCWKLSERFGVRTLARRVQQTGRTGWYFRVLEAGRMRTGDWLELRDRPQPDWPLARILHALYRDMMDPGTLQGIASLQPLSASWRRLAQTRLDRRVVEDWTARLDGGDGSRAAE